MRQHADKAITALSELERMAGEPVAWTSQIEIDWAKRNPGRAGSFYAVKEGPSSLPLYTAAPVAQQQYEAGDMASAHNDGFRAGVASVSQQPKEIEVQCPVCSHKFYEWPNDQQPQAEAVPSDWAPTAANINALPAPVRAYIHDMVANADPAGTVRDLSISKQIIRELEASNRMLRDRLAEAVPNDVTRDAARYLWLRSKVGVSPEHERAYIWLPCGNSKINPAETDAAIDAAMAQGANHG